VGDVVQAPHERWHRATFHGTGMATRLAITPRDKGSIIGSRTRKETGSELRQRLEVQASFHSFRFTEWTFCQWMLAYAESKSWD
jgi:hypothetical protein